MKKALIGGSVAAVIIFLGSWSVGRLSSGEALQLLQSIQPTIRFMASSVMTATATILALILTMLSFTSSRDKKFKADFFNKVQLIAKITTITFIAALVLLMFLGVPFLESEKNLRVYYSVIYYFIQVYAALVGGALITIMVLLYDAAANIIVFLHPEAESEHLLVSEEEE